MGDKKRALCVGLLAGADREKLMEQFHDRLSGGCVDFAAAVDCRIRVRYNKNQKGCE